MSSLPPPLMPAHLRARGNERKRNWKTAPRGTHDLFFFDVSRTCNLTTRAFIQYTYILPHTTQTFVFLPWHHAFSFSPFSFVLKQGRPVAVVTGMTTRPCYVYNICRMMMRWDRAQDVPGYNSYSSSLGWFG